MKKMGFLVSCCCFGAFLGRLFFSGFKNFF